MSELNPALVALLVCPQCHSAVALTDDGTELACTGCPLAYPIRSGIPVMLVDDARRREN